MNQHEANLRRAYAVMLKTPAERVNLDDIRCFHEDTLFLRNNVSDEEMLHSCGSSGCVAGWCSADPHFKEQGLAFSIDWVRMEIDGETVDDLCALSSHLFGVPNIFDCSEEWYDEDNRPINGKRQALERIRRGLDKQGVLTNEEHEKMIQQEKEF